MTLAQLRYVITVSQVGTLSEAAKRLYISQPSLTNAIKELSNGNYNVRVDNVGQDEISKLNQGFNQILRCRLPDWFAVFFRSETGRWLLPYRADPYRGFFCVFRV